MLSSLIIGKVSGQSSDIHAGTTNKEMAESVTFHANSDIPETQYRYDVKDLPTSSVTVYEDRAEVKRTVKVEFEKTGICEVVIHNLSASCDLDSIRIDGQGKATITEVSSVEKLEQREKDESAVKTLRDQKVELDDEIRVVISRKDRADKHRLILIGLGDQVKDSPTQKHTATVSLLTSEGLEGVIKFLDLYDEQLKRCDDDIFQLDKELKDLVDKSLVLTKKINETGTSANCLEVIRQVSVLLDVKEPEEITLTVSYLTSGASWVPKYDIRAFTADVAVKITYFALITQKTGEDWNDAKIFLSTAQPSIGGDAPELPSQTVHFKSIDKYFGSTKRKGKMLRSRKSSYAKANVRSLGVDDVERASEVWELDSIQCASKMMAPPPMDIMTSEVKDGGLSTSYEIGRRSTIPSDNTEHKVTVGLLDLKPEFEHFAAPKMVPSSFLKAKVTNESSYLLLAGVASTFVDNNFIAKSSLPTVSPMEKFELSLGVDSAVRVKYKPLQKIAESSVIDRLREEPITASLKTLSGIFSKISLTRFKQVTEIKNTRQHDVTIQVEEQLPRSESDKIKVNLVAPVLPKQKGAVTPDAPLLMNAKGNIVWRSVIKAGETETFLVHYTVEKAAGEKQSLGFADL